MAMAVWRAGRSAATIKPAMLVVGIEGEGFWSGIKTNFETNFVIPPFGAVTYETKNKYDYDVALRLGIALDRTLIYGKIGWVWGQFDFRFYDNNPGGVPYTHTGSSGLSGLLLGLGAEHALGGNWSVKFEYNYLNFAARSVAFTHCFLPGACFHELNESQSAREAHRETRHQLPVRIGEGAGGRKVLSDAVSHRQAARKSQSPGRTGALLIPASVDTKARQRSDAHARCRVGGLDRLLEIAENNNGADRNDRGGDARNDECLHMEVLPL